MSRCVAPILVVLTFVLAAAAGAGAPPTEHYIHIPIDDRAEIQTLTEVVSIDGFESPSVLKAYATDSQLRVLTSLGYRWTEQIHPGQRPGRNAELRGARSCLTGFDCYPTYSEYVQRMEQYVAEYPDLCRLYDIGDTQEGLDLLVVKISDNPDSQEDEPEVFYTSTMHGDETTGFVLMLRLIDWLLTNYGSDSTATDMVDEMEIWINPNANPDGTYRCAGTVCTSMGAPVRSYLNGQDPNRSFPDPGDPNYNFPWEIETQAMIDFAASHSIVLSANFHGGIELVNYPWDNIYSGFADQYHVDDLWLERASRAYADSAQANSPAGYMTGQDNGITNGYDWYSTRGSRQDFMTFYHGCRETTIELSDTKYLPASQLHDHWTYNEEALQGYLMEALHGLRGVVTGPGGAPVDAMIEVLGHDSPEDRSWVYTDPDVGDYHRMIEPGTYDLKVAAWGYDDVYSYGAVVSFESATRADLVMTPTSTAVAMTGTLMDIDSATPVGGATVRLVGVDVSPGVSDDAGQYTLPAVEPGTYSVQVSHPQYNETTQSRDVSSGQSVHDFELTQSVTVSGAVTTLASGDPVSGASVVVLSHEMRSWLTSADGGYVLPHIPDGVHTFEIRAPGFATLREQRSVSAAEATHEFAIEPLSIWLSTDLESDDGSLNATNKPPTSGWEWGTPSGNGPAAHSGNSVWATTLDGTYNNGATAILETPELWLPESTLATLTFWHWYSLEGGYDGGTVQISVDGDLFADLTPVGGYPDDFVSSLGRPGFTGSHTQWKQVTVDLTPYAGHNVIIRWLFGSDYSATQLGWYLDDIAVTTEVADFQASPLTATIGQDIQFTDLSTGSPTAWLWDLGDGNTSTEQHPTHAYDTADTYTVSLTATYGAGDATRTRTNYITVTDACTVTFAGLASAVQPAIDIAAADLSWAAASSTCGGPMTYDVWVSAPGGSVSFAGPPALTGLEALQHRVLGLTGAADYEFGVRARDGLGTSDDNTITITVTTAGHASGETDSACAGGSADVTTSDLEQIVAVLFGAPECSDPGFALSDVNASGATDAGDLASECTYLAQGLY